MKKYDLTHFIKEDMCVYSKEEKVEIKKIADYEEGYSVTKVTFGTHTGTHIDVQKHIFKDGKSLDDYGIDNFFGKVLIIDCKEKEKITLNFIKGEIRPNFDYIIFYTGYEKLWGKDSYFNGYPILDRDAVNFLGNLKGLKGIGVDCISVDSSENLYNHEILLKNDKLIIENLCNLDGKLGEYDIIVAPMKIKNGDGAPVRVFIYR
ncbi:cyclase family protein [Clostridium chrysemydis]|uniref:cyclase family protein n=1 Tax=Clostridium chrysemydis TaxID=2665504 RepID=UPI001883FF26|nr:cyclase family protein [Clostridium chrysemydis]